VPTVSVVGGSGYIGQEILRLVAQHPSLELKVATSRQHDGQKISKVLPHLAGYVQGSFTGDLSKAGDADLVFVSTPHGQSFPLVKEFLARGAKVVELGGDYRFKNAATYEKWYGHKHEDPENLGNAVYGLPELNRDAIKKAALVANPGCYATASALALAPLVKKSLVSGTIFIDAKSGVSGAGKEASEFTHFPNVSGNVLPYKIGKHRHAPEIQETLETLGASSPVPGVIFTPHLVPVVRGILTTSYVPLGEGVGSSSIQDAFAKTYSGCAFVRLQEETPTMQQVVGSNVCAISASIVESPAGGSAALVVVSTIDNLIKGGAGQAVQNANLLLGLKEEAGLLSPALGV
jgi:N-acetyl-gamma-glutamyl-phosphate reductase